MGAAGSKLSQRGIQQLQKLKTAVDNMPSGDITPQMLDRILENQSFTPKTDALFKQVREKMEREMKDSSSDFATSFAYAQQKDEQFVSKLTGDFRSMASETVNKEELPIESTGVLPQDRSNTPYEVKHIPGRLTTEELQSLFSNEDLIVNASGREQLARLYDLPEDSLDALLRYVAIPKMEKRREETKELDAVWPKWKQQMSSFVFSNTQVESLIECLQLLQQHVITIAHNSSTINPTSQTRANRLLAVAIVQENHARPIFLVPKRSPNRLIHGFYAEIGVVILSKSRFLLVQILHLFLQHHIRLIGIGHAHNSHTATQIIAEIDSFGEFSANHSKQERSLRWMFF